MEAKSRSEDYRAIADFLRAVLVVLLVGYVLCIVFLPMLASTGRPTPSQRASIACRQQVRIWRNVATNDTRFDFFKLPHDQQQNIIFMGDIYDVWIKTNFVWGTPSNREIVVLSGRAVAKPGLWNKLMGTQVHAVAYSDGSGGFISPEEYSTNKNQLIHVKEFPPDLVSNILPELTK